MTRMFEKRAEQILGPPGDVLFHYTSLDTVVRHILPTGMLRMNPFSAMRDPREYKAWHPAAVGYVEPTDAFDGDTYSEGARVLNALKERFKLLALTMDDPNDDSIYGRGFARSRLWEAYGDRGRGVCLVYDKALLVATLMPQLKRAGVHPRADAVRYRNRPVDLTFDIRGVIANGIEAEVARLAKRHVDELFLTKLTDWESEHEYRFIVGSDSPDPLFVTARDALRAVVIGYECAREFLPTLRSLCREPRVTVALLEWWNSRPQLTAPSPE